MEKVFGFIIGSMGIILSIIVTFCCIDVSVTSDDMTEKIISFCLLAFGILASAAFIIAGFSGSIKI